MTEWMISVDDHVIEPPDVWTNRLPQKYKDLGPRWVNEGAGPCWAFEDVRTPINSTVTGGAIADHSKRPSLWKSLDFDEIDPACYDPKARVRAMDSDHVLASILFPNVTRFCGQLFAEAKDKELALLCVRAYNDWMIDEWCGAAPERFIPNVIIPLWDAHLGAAELERTAAKGARAFCFSQAPHRLGLPSIHDKGRYWDPVLRTANDANLVVCTHLGSASQLPETAADAPMLVSTTLLQFVGQETLLDWLFSDNFERFPDLKLCLSENGIGWIPALLEVAEWFVEAGRSGMPVPGQKEEDVISAPLAGASPELDEQAEPEHKMSGFLLPSDEELRVLTERMQAVLEVGPRERFRKHVYGCFIKDDHGVRNLDEIGIDNVMIETDFPHLTSCYPESGQIAEASLSKLSPDDRYKVLEGNARRVFRWNVDIPVDRS
jgi:predicted TIM-barrel fold metal-dependent hydrolase